MYLLNAFEDASQSDMPSEHGYAGKRKAVKDYVESMSADLAAAKALNFDLAKVLGLYIECVEYMNEDIPVAFRNVPAQARAVLAKVSK